MLPFHSLHLRVNSIIVLLAAIILVSMVTFVAYRWYKRPVRSNVVDRMPQVQTPNTHGTEWNIHPKAKELRGKIVFASNITGQFDIYVLKNGRITPIISSPQPESYPRWSPDGHRIAFQRKLNGQWDIWIYDTISGHEIQLTDSPTDEENPSWYPDGRSVIFDTTQAPRRQLFRCNIESKECAQVTHGALSRNALGTISPDGRIIALTSNQWWGWSIGLYHPDTDTWTILVKGNSCRPAWSHDGRRIAFVHMGWDKKGDIALWDMTSKTFRNLTPERSKTYDYDPRWSPNEKWIIFQSSTDKKHGNWDLWLVSPDDGTTLPLIQAQSLEIYPDWIP